MLPVIYTENMDEVANGEYLHCVLAGRSRIVMAYSSDSVLGLKHYFSVTEMFESFY